ncbi:hypothetical protein Tco_0303824 [Tanacetum coccineum]
MRTHDGVAVPCVNSGGSYSWINFRMKLDHLLEQERNLLLPSKEIHCPERSEIWRSRLFSLRLHSFLRVEMELMLRNGSDNRSNKGRHIVAQDLDYETEF